MCHRLFGEGPCPALPESSLALGLLHKSFSGLLSLMFSLIYGPFPFRSTLKFLPALYSDSYHSSSDNNQFLPPEIKKHVCDNGPEVGSGDWPSGFLV